MSTKIVIGISGPNGSGKDTVCNYIKEKYQAEKLVFADLLHEALIVFIDKIGRSDYAWLSTNLRERYGEGIMAESMKRKIEKSAKNLIVLSGVRDLGEFDMIKAYKKGYLIHVEADIEARWERLAKRNVKADDRISFEEFKEGKEKLPSEKRIGDLKEKADYLIDNDGGLEDLEKKVDEALAKILK